MTRYGPRSSGRKAAAYKALPLPEQKKIPRPKEPISFLAEDTTPEALQNALATLGRGTLLLKDEVAGFLGLGRYSQSGEAAERGFYLQSYEAAPYTKHRCTGSIYIANSGLTTAAASSRPGLPISKGSIKMASYNASFPCRSRWPVRRTAASSRGLHPGGPSFFVDALRKIRNQYHKGLIQCLHVDKDRLLVYEVSG